jgi:predicted dehydrogenase
MGGFSMIEFGIIGGGWRTQFFLRIARALPERFRITGILVRNEEKGRKLHEEWGVPVFTEMSRFLETTPSFVVVSVSWPAAPVYTRELAALGVPVLSETPPAPDLEGLIALNELTERGAKIQVAEQYQFQPLHASRIAVARSGRIGEPSQAQLSVCHGYHAVSLMRLLLGIGYENVTVRGRKHRFPLVQGIDFTGKLPEQETIAPSEQVIAELDWDGKLAIYDFTGDQYFSWIRTLRLLVRGERGEIADTTVRYLEDYRTPCEYELLRHNAGENGNLEGYYLKGISGGGEWLYRNPFAPGRITDDEIAIATCLEKMDAYMRGGPSFYSLAEASQDHYLSMLINRSAETGETLRSSYQPWSGKV